MCDLQVFPLSEDQFEALKEKAAKAGLPMFGVGGTIVQHGATVEWDYDGTAMKVQVLPKPFYVSCDVVNEKLKELIQG